MKQLLFFFCTCLFVSSCCRNLEEPITLYIDTSTMQFSYGNPNGSEDYFTGSSSAKQNEMLADLRSLFNEKGNDVTLGGSDARYRLEMLSCDFHESCTRSYTFDPCDSVSPDTTWYDVVKLTVSMRCYIHDNMTSTSTPVFADASDEERIKDHPTILQSLFGGDCYTPRVSSIHFAGKLQRRVLRRIHHQTLCAIKRRQ